MIKLGAVKKFTAILANLSLLLNSFVPFLLAIQPAYAQSPAPLESTIEYNQSTHKFNIGVNTTEKVNYQLIYKTDKQIESTVGNDVSSDTNFSREILAGTCSDKDCTFHNIKQGLLKVEVPSSNWIYSQFFSFDNNSFKVVKQVESSQYDLTDEENEFLENGTLDLPPPTETETENTDSINTEPAEVPTPTVTVTPEVLGETINGTIETIVVPNNMSRIDLLNPVLFTDKDDYSPTEIAIITGSNFSPNTEYLLVVTSNDLSLTYTITTDANGEFTYSYQLDGTYRPDYKVEVKNDLGIVIASTTFTDSVSWPNCNYSCAANDVIIQKMELVSDTNGTPLVCNPDDTVAAYIKVTYDNHSTTRHAVYLKGDIYQDGIPKQAIDSQASCVDDLTTILNYKIMTTGFSWDCGSSISIKNIILSWGTNSSTCNGIFVNGNCNPPGQSFCNDGLDYIVTTPLIADFTAPPVCLGIATEFTSTTTGGKTPYTNYVWQFGDSLSNGSGNTTTHTYSVAGTYPVILTVTDSTPQSDSETKTVTINQCATCGDGIQNQASEECDDGNTNDTDACSNSCTFTKGHLIVQKTTVPASDPTVFSINVTSSTGGTITGGGSGTITDLTDKDYEVTPGTYSVTETYAADLWKKTGDTCQDVIIGAGETKYCEITNTKLGKIVIKKVMVGGTDSFDFAGDVNGTISTNNGTLEIDNALTDYDYRLQESLKTGWELTDITCDDGSSNNPSLFDIPTRSAIFRVDPGEIITCTFTNTRKQGKIELQKDFVGTPSGVYINIGTDQEGSQIDSDWIFGSDGTSGENTVNTGNYYVSETLIIDAPYTSALACFNDINNNNAVDGGDTPHNVNTTTGEVSVGENEDVICVFTNTRDQGTIELKKHWDGTPGSTILTISGMPGSGLTVDTETVSGADGTTGQNTVNTGSYILSESNLPDYTTSLTCFSDEDNNGTNDNEPSVSVGTLDSVYVLKDQHVVCTFTNTLQTGTLRVIKNVVDISETPLDPSNWSINVTQNGNDVTGSPQAGSSTGTVYTLQAGIYQVAEPNPEALDKTFGVSFSGACARVGPGSPNQWTTGNVSVVAGQESICILTNERRTGIVTVNKEVDINGDGTFDGDNAVSNLLGFRWGFHDEPVNRDMGTSLVYGGVIQLAHAVIHENTVPGYHYVGYYSNTTPGFSCSNPYETGYPHFPIDIPHYDEDIVVLCNARDTGTITLDKITDPSGGTQEFTFHVVQIDSSSWNEATQHFNPILSGFSQTYNITDLATPPVITVPTGNYDIYEDLPNGWTQSGYTCQYTVGIRTGGGIMNYNFDIRTGENATCTFTNSQYGSISGQKYNDLNGDGDKDSGEIGLQGWTINLYNETGNSELASTTTDSQGDYSFTNILPGNYQVGEVAQTGWANTDPGAVYPIVYKQVSVTAEQESVVNFGNFEKGTVYVDKYEDTDGVLGRTEGQEFWIGDPTFSFRLYQVENDSWALLGQADTNSDGRAVFDHLLASPGNYRVCEIKKADWEDMRSLHNQANNLSGATDEYSVCDGITVSTSGYQVYSEFGNIQKGEVTVYKFHDLDADGIHDDNEPYLPNWDITVNQVDTTGFIQKTDETGKTIFSLNPGDYVLGENMQEGWYQSNIYCEDIQPGVLITSVGEAYGHHGACEGWNGCGDAATCAQWACEVNGYDTLVSYGDQKPCTQFNNCNLFYDRGEIEYNWGNWCPVMGVTDIKCSGPTTPSGDKDLVFNLKNIFKVGEVLAQSAPSNRMTIEPGQSKTCHIGNYQKATVTVTKDVLDHLGQPIEDNHLFTVSVTGQEETGFSELSPAIYNLNPGTYTLSEINIPSIYQLKSDNDITITVTSGESKSVNFINWNIPATLTISKSNNRWPTAQSIGSEVEYTITLKAENNGIKGVSVIDLPPYGFKYKAGSWKVLVHGVERIIPEPIYSSPGTWLIGDLNKDDVATLTYIATIEDSVVDPGTYKDATWAYGCETSQDCTLTSSDKLLAQAVDPGYLATTFVGTQIKIDPVFASQDINIVREEGQVLGATTEMPSTGANTVWLLIFSLLSTLGIGSILYGSKSKRKNIMKNLIIITLIGLASLFSIKTVNAIQSSNIFITIEEPVSPTNKDKFDISFTTLDILNRELTVKCFKINPDSSETQIGTIDIKAGGNSGECSLENNPLIENEKTYGFYAVASTGGEEYQSEKVYVDYDTSGPGTPNDYSKEKEGTCNYKISFKASNDGNTNIIRIYRADVTKFIADAGSQIGQVGISPDQKGSFTDVNVPDCNKTYYYVIRAFDEAGNGSGLVGDSVTVYTSTTTDTTSSVSGGAIPVIGDNNIPSETELGDQEDTSSEEGQGPGSILGTETPDPKSITTQFQSFISRHKFSSALVAALLLIIIGYGINKARKKRR